MYLEASPMTIFLLASNTPLISKFYVLISKIDGEEMIMEEIRIKNKYQRDQCNKKMIKTCLLDVNSRDNIINSKQHHNFKSMRLH